MAVLSFGDFPADMTDADFFGFLQDFFPGHLIVASALPSEIMLVDSVTGSRINVTGNFAVPSVNSAQISGLAAHGRPSDQLLVEMTNISLTLGQLTGFGLNSNALLAFSMQGLDVVHGGRFTDTLFGFAGDDELIGSSGNDLLNGGLGADRMVGGGGNNTYIVDNAGDVVVEDPNVVEPPNYEFRRVSTDPNGAQSNGGSDPAVSADGRFVAFASYATNLGPEDDNFVQDIYVKDMLTGAVQLLAVPPGLQFTFESAHPSISPDGRYVVLENHNDIYLADLQTGALDMISAGVVGRDAVVSGDGRYVAFTADGFTPAAGDMDEATDVLIRDLSQPISNRPLTPGSVLVAGPGKVLEYAPSGALLQQFLLHTSSVQDVVVDPSGKIQLYTGTNASGSDATALATIDPATGTLASHTAAGWSTGFSLIQGGIAAYGHFVFVTDMKLPGETDDQRGLIRFDTTDFSFVRFASHDYTDVTVGLDGQVYALAGAAIDVFDPDTLSPVRTIALQGFDLQQPGGIAVDASGTIYAIGGQFGTKALAVNSSGQVLRAFDLGGQIGVSIDVRSDGLVVIGTEHGTVTLTDTEFSNHTSFYAGDQLTGVTFYSLPDPGTPFIPQAGWKEASSSALAQPANGASGHAEMTPDAHYIVFDSVASNLVAGDTNGVSDVFVKNLSTGLLQRVSTSANGTEANGDSQHPAITPDGRYVVFESRAGNLVNGVFDGQIYLKDLQTGAVNFVSVDAVGNVGGGIHPTISADGRFIAFESSITDFGVNSVGALNVFLKDMTTGQVAKISVPPTGPLASAGGSDPVISADGRYVVFVSQDPNLVHGDTNRTDDVFEVANPFLSTAPHNFDVIQTSVSYTLPEGVEKLMLMGSANLNGTGNGLNNILVGNAGANILDGGAGDDTMAGGAGNDTYYVDSAADVLQEAGSGFDQVFAQASFSLPDNVEKLVLRGSANLTGTGNALDNVLVSNAGLDVLTGGAGDDVYEVGVGTVVIEAAHDGTDTVRAPGDFSLPDNVENLELSGAALNATGNATANRLTGTDGANSLDGGRGGDSMAGGLGDDTYKVDNGLDQVSELAAQGNDAIISQVPQTLAANVESLTLGDAAGNIEGIGNTSNNLIVGNNAANLLDGGGGSDTLKGQGGEDTLLGGAGDDALSGGLGRDVLNGGAGADHFVFDSAIASGTNVDQVLDFVHGQDSIDLSVAIFAAAGVPGAGLNAVDFVSGAGAVAHDGTDHVIHDTNTGMVYYDADGSGAQQMIAFAQVVPGQALAASDLHIVA